MLPTLVAHADWSVRPGTRWLALATWQPDGRYRAGASQPVGPLETLWARLAEAAGGGHALLGFDFPIGLPIAYANRAGIAEFRAALPGFVDRFYAAAERPDEIDLEQPFYPMRPAVGGDGICWLPRSAPASTSRCGRFRGHSRSCWHATGS